MIAYGGMYETEFFHTIVWDRKFDLLNFTGKNLPNTIGSRQNWNQFVSVRLLHYSKKKSHILMIFIFINLKVWCCLKNFKLLTVEE